MEVRLTPGGNTVPEAPPGEGRSVRRAFVFEVGEILRRRNSGSDAQDRPVGLGLDREDLKDLLRRTTDVVEALGPRNRHLKYEVIEEADMVQIQVVNNEDGQVVRRIPADEIIEMVKQIHKALSERLDVMA